MSVSLDKAETVLATAETTVPTVPSILIPVGVLRDLVSAAVAAGKDDTLPTLTGVRLEWGSDGVRAVATDRYRLAVVTWDGKAHGVAGSMLDGIPDGDALVPARDLVAYVKGLPKPRKNDRQWTGVRVRPLGYAVQFTCITVDGAELSRTIPTLEGQYPKWESLMPSEFTGTDGAVAMNPGYVADVARMPLERNDSVRVEFNGPTRPMVWSGGNGQVTWRYLLMPVRIPG